MSGRPSSDTDAPPDPAGMEDVTQRVRAIIAENDRLFSRLLEGEKRFRRLAKAVWKVQEEERRRLALELHDGIGQTLTALKNHLQRQRKRCGDDAEQLVALEQAFDLAAAALADTRELSRLLRPPVLDDLGLKAALEWLVRIQRERTGLRAEIDWQLETERLEPELETLIFRAVQEALTNVVKHAGCEWAKASVYLQNGYLQVSIEDDGQGFDPLPAFETQDGSDGFGLRGLRDRVELFGGRVAIKPRKESGTCLRILLPLSDTKVAAGTGR